MFGYAVFTHWGKRCSSEAASLSPLYSLCPHSYPQETRRTKFLDECSRGTIYRFRFRGLEVLCFGRYRIARRPPPIGSYSSPPPIPNHILVYCRTISPSPRIATSIVTTPHHSSKRTAQLCAINTDAKLEASMYTSLLYDFGSMIVRHAVDPEHAVHPGCGFNYRI